MPPGRFCPVQGGGAPRAARASIGAPIGHKGMMTAAKVFALTTADLLQNPKEIQDAKAEFDKVMKGRKYTTIIPKGQQAPKSIR